MIRFRPTFSLVLAIVLGSAGAVPGTTYAQDGHHPEPFPDAGHASTPRWVGHFAIFSANALLGGVTGGVHRRLRGGSFADGLAGGMLGGAGTYVGKRVAARHWDGAGLVGRQVAALGTSASRNAGEGRGALEHVALPVGPVRVHVQSGAVRRVHASVDLHSLFWTGYGLAEPALAMDVGASLSAGAFVFRADHHEMRWRRSGSQFAGLAPPGNIFLAAHPDPGGADWNALFAHERVHILQYDQAFHTVVDPLETALLEQLAGLRRAHRYLDANLLLLLPSHLLNRAVEYGDQPWEIEAHFLAGQW